MCRRFFALSTFLCLALAGVASAQLPDPFSISAFNVTGGVFVELDNFIVRNPRHISRSDTLPDIGSPPAFIQPGQVVMRKKFGADYRLYIGDLDTVAFRAFPPVYTFPLPAWSRSGQAMWYRFYTKPTTNRNLDLETVFFDNERIYVQHHSKIYYSRNDEWESIEGTTGAPFGELHIDSDPPEADIYLYGRATGKKTPAVLKKMIGGRYEVELFLPDYRFQRRSVAVPAGGAATTSFHMMSDFDTLLVIGERQHGILVLPYPPLDSAYRIGDTLEVGFTEELLEGDYRITWSGGGIYRDIDTVIEVPAGQMAYFNAPFVRLGGSATFQLFPIDALLCIEGFPCGPGGTTVELPSGFHTARISRFGYKPERRKFIVSHGKQAFVRVKLETHDDRDFDGFVDSIDKCPDVYGLYDGCPKPDFKTSARLRYEELSEYMETEPFTFAVAGIGYISRGPTSRRFNNFMSSFSGGLSGGLNNYAGINIGNIYQASYRGFMAQAELGQWATGVKYRRPDTLMIRTDRDRYLVWYDSLYRIDPAVFFPSTAVSVGFKYRLHNYSVGYSLGHQWEDIIIDQIQRMSDGEFRRVTFSNDWWFHELMFEADMFMDTFMSPSLYTKFKLPFGPTERTKWHVFQIGLQFRLRPEQWKGRI